MKGVVLAGGHGTRLRPLTHTGPKQFIPLANKPNILYCIEDLREAGIVDIGVILGDVMPEKVKQMLEDGSEFGVRITYIVQGPPRGIAHAISCAESFVGSDPFCVYLGDNVLKGGIKPMVEDFLQNQYDAEVMLCHVSHPERFGVAELDDQGEIVSLWRSRRSLEATWPSWASTCSGRASSPSSKASSHPGGTSWRLRRRWMASEPKGAA